MNTLFIDKNRTIKSNSYSELDDYIKENLKECKDEWQLVEWYDRSDNMFAAYWFKHDSKTDTIRYVKEK